MKLAELKTVDTDRAKVSAWLDHINETDEVCRAEVIAQCESDKDARAYYVSRFNEDCK